MAKKRNKKRLNSNQNQVAIQIAKIDGNVRKTQAIAPWFGGSIIAFFVWRSIHDLAGQMTIADIKVLANATFNSGSGTSPAWYVVAASVFLGSVGLLYGLRQRKLRRDTIERLHPYQLMWEEQHLANRTSSMLTPRGDTRREDR